MWPTWITTLTNVLRSLQFQGRTLRLLNQECQSLKTWKCLQKYIGKQICTAEHHDRVLMFQAFTFKPLVSCGPHGQMFDSSSPDKHCLQEHYIKILDSVVQWHVYQSSGSMLVACYSSANPIRQHEIGKRLG